MKLSLLINGSRSSAVMNQDCLSFGDFGPCSWGNSCKRYDAKYVGKKKKKFPKSVMVRRCMSAVDVEKIGFLSSSINVAIRKSEIISFYHKLRTSLGTINSSFSLTPTTKRENTCCWLASKLPRCKSNGEIYGKSSRGD